MGCVYFIAFCSLYIQYPGLYGINGILPIHDFTKNTSQRINIDIAKTDNFFDYPSIFRYASNFGVSADAWCECLLLLGMAVSIIVSAGSRRPIWYLILYVIYLSIYHTGQVFLNFQWDMLLLEAGFLFLVDSVLRYDTKYRSHMNWCFRFVIWKFMFMAGVVKLQSKCPTWEHLTALEVRSDANLSVPLSDFLQIYTVPFCYAVPSQCNCVVCPSSPPPSPAHWGSRHTAH